ncbi:MAG: hypothetical protein QXM58_00530 [Candidatus Micrarchaeaceae archaeon]
MDYAKPAKEYTAVALIFLILALLLFWPMAMGIASTVPNGGGDLYQTLWNLWWVGYAMLTLHTSIYFSDLLYYPIGASLVTQTLSPLACLFSLPFQAVNLVFAYNIIFFVDFMLAGLFMYMLAYHIVKNKHAAFVAGIIFAFAPMHIAQSLGHLQWASIEFVPLFILLFMLTIERRRIIYPVGAGISFVFVTFWGDPEQGIMAFLLALLMLIYYLASRKRGEVLNVKFAVNLFVMIAVVLAVGSPFLVPIIKGIENGALAQAAQLSDLQHNMLWSDPVASFFLPSPNNIIFSSLSNSYKQIYSVDPAERVSYLGYIAIFLALYGLFRSYKDKNYSVVAFWVVAFLIFAWLSLGPYVQLGSPHSVGGIPGIYLLYRQVPVLNLIREAGRFDMITTIALAVLAAYGFKELMQGLENAKHHSENYARYITAFFVFLILLEYSGFAVNSSNFIAPHIPKAYYEIGNMTGNFTVLVLPATANYSSNSPALYLGMQMYYQTAFKKPIITGYTTRTNETELLPQETLPLVQAASSLEATGKLAYSSPIITNYTNVTLLWMRNFNIRFVSVIRQAYNQSDFEQLASYLYSVFGLPVYQSNTTTVFLTTQAVSRAGSSFVAYPGPNWLPGWYVCEAYGIICNATIDSLWFGSNVREIVAYTPIARSYNMSFQSFAPSPTSISVYLNGGNITDLVNEFPASGVQNRRVSLNLRKGYNLVFFYAPNSTSVPKYMNFAVGNITFS